jgi:hypothetical protein
MFIFSIGHILVHLYHECGGREKTKDTRKRHEMNANAIAVKRKGSSRLNYIRRRENS